MKRKFGQLLKFILTRNLLRFFGNFSNTVTLVLEIANGSIRDVTFCYNLIRYSDRKTTVYKRIAEAPELYADDATNAGDRVSTLCIGVELVWGVYYIKPQPSACKHIALVT